MYGEIEVVLHIFMIWGSMAARVQLRVLAASSSLPGKGPPYPFYRLSGPHVPV
jgi:hypothetical protein